MLVIVNGLPYFSEKIVADLNEYDRDNKYIFFNTYYSKWAQLKFLLTLPFCGAVLSFNGVSDNSNSLNWVLRFKKKLIMQWHGSDVELAIQRHKTNTINRNYIDNASHLVSAPWFSNELKGIIDQVSYAPFGYVTEFGNKQKYGEISILTYIPKGREEYYGWREVEELAESLPEFNITVCGTTGENLKQHNNIQFLGWVSEKELLNLMKKHSIFIRLTEHDGKAITVSQALSVGCEVIWTQPFEHCHFIKKNASDLILSVHKSIEIISKRGYLPNEESILYAKKELMKDAVMANYLRILKDKLNG